MILPADVVGPRYTMRESCRGCGHPEFVSVLDLGHQPLANGFRAKDDASPEYRFPLHLVRCPVCELVQLTCVVDPQVLYGQHYPYRSGYSDAWVQHCHALAKQIGKGKSVLEIGCLDGVLLRHCRDNGCTVLGIDPSAPPLEIPVLRELFTRETRPGQFDVVVAQNVLGHVDDARGFLQGVQFALQSGGEAIIECPWVVELIDGVEWDTVYHEHLSYWGLRPLMRLAREVGLAVTRVQSFPALHGGLMRYTLRHMGQREDPSVQALYADEQMEASDWKRFRVTAEEQALTWNHWFTITDHRIAAFGASAKLNTFLNSLPDKPPIICLFDDIPAKRGLVSPGWRFPVVEPSREALAQIDTLLVGASNWKTAIEARARDLGFRGDVRSLW